MCFVFYESGCKYIWGGKKEEEEGREWSGWQWINFIKTPSPYKCI